LLPGHVSGTRSTPNNLLSRSYNRHPPKTVSRCLSRLVSTHLPTVIFKPLSKPFQHDYLLNPITALEVHHSRPGLFLILAGEGSFLKIFHAEDARLLHQCEIFHDQIIHGIAVRDSVDHEVGLQVVIWGGPSLMLLTRQEFDRILDQTVSSIADVGILASDWILDVAISPFDAVGCVLVTAHNTIIRARLGDSPYAPIMETLHSPSRSILYSAHLIWESLCCVLVAAGTVFGEIIVWQCSPSDETSSQASRVLFTFTGHEGSIFGVNISPPIIGLHGCNRLLASCSDDRTIRIWNLSADSNNRHPAATAVRARETGFGENDARNECTESRNSNLTMVMGHSSRIWRVRFLGDQSAPLDSSAISILSFGEDSTAQQWALRFDKSSYIPVVHPQLSARLDHLHTFAFHSGKHIWSTALQRKDDSKAILATGGADGKIARYASSYPTKSPLTDDTNTLSPNKQATSDELTWARSWNLDEIMEAFELKSVVMHPVLEQPTSDSSVENSLESIVANTTKKRKAKKVLRDSFNRYAFISGDEVLATTTSGRVLLCRIGSKVQWSEVTLPESGPGDLRSYAVLVGLPEIGLACLAGANGSIYIYRRHHALLKVGKVEGKVADMFKIVDSRTASFELLVTTLGGTNATLFSFNLSGTQVRLVENAVYSLPSRFVVTSAGRNNGMLVMGSRSGSLALYTAMRPESPLHIWTHHSNIPKDAITTITSLPSSNDLGDTGSEYFLTTSRDGFYSIFLTTIFRNAGMVARVVVRQVHQSAPPFGPMIENAWFEEARLFLYGFKGKSFVVWNETEQCEITNVECGGSHRSYAYSPVRGSSGGYLVYTKASKLYLHSHQDSSHRIIKPGGHGREIKACAVSEDQTLIATGAEDTAIRIWQYNKMPNVQDPLVCQAVIQKHSAGIQHLQWHGSEYLFSSGGNEEFFIWAVEQIPGFGIGVICEATCPDPSEDKDLRVMNFDVTSLPNSSYLPFDPCLLISLAYSDSTIRSYTYSKRDSFHLVGSGRYTSSCLTQIRHVQVEDDEIHILTASTDGRLALWKTGFVLASHNGAPGPVQLAILSTQKIHQSAIKSLDFLRLNEQILVATGGDDNALGISAYPISGSMAATMPTCSILKSAHAAAVTGLSFLHDRKTESSSEKSIQSIQLVSSGNDQKVIAWNVDLNNDRGENSMLSLEKIGEAFTPVADIGDVSALEVNDEWGNVLVVGNGMEIWKITGHRGGDLGSTEST
jgi:WD repeat-containing protein 6